MKSKKPSRTISGEKLLNPNVNQYRLSKEQRIFYTELFNENATDGKVKKENFLPLLGILGTQISKQFCERMFYVLSKGQPEIILEDYLNYVDTYHYGDSHERCLYTCKLMDTKQKGIIDFEDFRSYINLIIDTVKKVNNSLSYQSDIISESDIRHLFLHISKGKKYFDYNDFENIYQDKPELVSWFNYFNNDKEDILLIINENLQTILKEMYEFLIVFMDELFYLLDKENEINLDSIFQKVSKYNYKLEKVISMFIDKISKFKNITAFYNNKDQGYLNSRLINEIKNKTFKYNNETGKNYDSLKDLNEFFSDVKKSLYKKEEKEIQLNNEGLKPGKNEFINKESKLRRQSTIFSGKNFKFKDTNDIKIKENYQIQNNNNLNQNINNYQNNINNNNIGQNININNKNFTNSNNNLNLNDYIINNNINEKTQYNNQAFNHFDDKSNELNNNKYQQNEDYQIYSGINFYSLKESGKLKLLLYFSRLAIEKSLEVSIIFNSCYKWISENYLVKTINKIQNEKKLKKKGRLKIRRSKSNVPKKMRPVKKNIIGASDKSFEILFNMIVGIQLAVQAIPNFKILGREDIGKYLTKMVYSIQTIYLGKEKEKSFLLQEYAGVVFNNIRLLFGISKDNFIKSISPQDFITELMISSQTIFEELCSTGKSGSLLFYTRDGEFILKTISRKEYKFLKQMLSRYYFYMKNNPISFLPKLLGCYVLLTKYKKKKTKIYFIVMSNVFATSNHIDLRFDLKGSKIGRRVLTGTTKDSKIFSNGDMSLKDLDFDKLKQKIYVGQKKDIILEQLRKDIEFLYSINSNDYSLLLGIHYRKNYTPIEKKKEDSLLSSKTYETNSLNLSGNAYTERKNDIKNLYDYYDFGISSVDNRSIYYFGIIDILTEYNINKRLEHCFKRIRYCSNDMSCIPPDLYKERFFNYMSTIFIKEENKNIEENENNTNSIFNQFIFKNDDKIGSINQNEPKAENNDESVKYL